MRFAPQRISARIDGVLCRAEPFAEFAAGTGRWMEQAPVLNNVMLTVVASRLAGHFPVVAGERWLRVEHDGRPVGGAMWTPPRGVWLGAMPDPAATALAEHLAATTGPGPALPSVTGTVATARVFADRFAALTGAAVELAEESRIYDLRTVSPPVGVSGAARPATTDDLALLLAWTVDFLVGADPRHAGPDPEAEARAELERRIHHPNMVWLWADGGRPVSMAWLNHRVAGLIRVSGVYTPPDLRGRGYASGCVAAISQWALDQGAERCMLFTDLRNPTSNKIYQALGYRPVTDVHELAFVSG
jgi:predicted GNAT family acetyltransferase